MNTLIDTFDALTDAPDTQETDHAAIMAASLDSLIQAAPDDTTPDSPEPSAASSAYTVRESHGWGRKYCHPIELRGDKWFEAFRSALPVIATGGIVAMVGDRGPGKTQMAAEIARSGEWASDKEEYARGDGLIVFKGKTALYRRAMDIFLDLREASKNHIKSSEKEVLAKLANVGLLVIDEFQERGESEWENRVMKNLLDKRYASERPTIIIANLTRKEMFDALGDSIVDRARENGKSIEFNWPSYRSQP